MGVVLACHDCGSKREPQYMYRKGCRAGIIWECEDCYQKRRRRFKGNVKRPEKVMPYVEQQRIHRAKWKRFEKVMKSDGNNDSVRSKKNFGHEQVDDKST